MGGFCCNALFRGRRGFSFRVLRLWQWRIGNAMCVCVCDIQLSSSISILPRYFHQCLIECSTQMLTKNILLWMVHLVWVGGDYTIGMGLGLLLKMRWICWVPLTQSCIQRNIRSTHCSSGVSINCMLINRFKPCVMILDCWNQIYENWLTLTAGEYVIWYHCDDSGFEIKRRGTTLINCGLGQMAARHSRAPHGARVLQTAQQTALKQMGAKLVRDV